VSKPARNKRLLVALTEEEHSWLRGAAVEQGTTMSELLRRLSHITERASTRITISTSQKRAADGLREY